MKKILLGLLLLVMLIIGVIFSMKVVIKNLDRRVPSEFEINKSYATMIYTLEINGIVTKKFLDQDNFHKETIQIKQFDDNILKLTFATETNRIFDYIKKDDTIYKSSESYKVRLKREKSDTTIILKFISFSGIDP